MALKVDKKLNDKLNKMYENQSTTNVTSSVNFVDRSEDLLKYMNFVALNNKTMLNIK